jgi:hypothetical protein
MALTHPPFVTRIQLKHSQWKWKLHNRGYKASEPPITDPDKLIPPTINDRRNERRARARALCRGAITSRFQSATRAVRRGLRARAEIQGDLIPGLRSLRSLNPGYYLSLLRGWLTPTSTLTLWEIGVVNIGRNPIKNRALLLAALHVINLPRAVLPPERDPKFVLHLLSIETDLNRGLLAASRRLRHGEIVGPGGIGVLSVNKQNGVDIGRGCSFDKSLRHVLPERGHVRALRLGKMRVQVPIIELPHHFIRRSCVLEQLAPG